VIHVQSLSIGVGDAAGYQSGIRRDGHGAGLDGCRHESSSPQKIARDEAVRRISGLDHESKRARQVLRRSEFLPNYRVFAYDYKYIYILVQLRKLQNPVCLGGGDRREAVRDFSQVN